MLSVVVVLCRFLFVLSSLGVGFVYVALGCWRVVVLTGLLF